MRTDENEPSIEYLQLLRDAANQVELWMADRRVLEVFRERIRPAADWYVNVHKVEEADKKRVEEEDLRAAMIDAKRRNKARSPGPDYEWVAGPAKPGQPFTKQDFHFMKRELGLKGTSWRGAQKASEEGRLGYWRRRIAPVCAAVPWLGFRLVGTEHHFELWPDRDKALSAYYCILATIHDYESVAGTLITTGIWPPELLDIARWELRGCYGDKTTVVESALAWVRQDLDAVTTGLDGGKGPAESEPDQKTTGLVQSGDTAGEAGKGSQRKQQVKKSNTVPKKSPRRPRKYPDATCEKAGKQFDDFYAESNDAFAAWNRVADNLDFPNGEAARKACTRYRQSQTSGQNGHN